MSQNPKFRNQVMGDFEKKKKHLFFFFFYKSGLIFSFWVMEVSFLRVRKGHIQFLMWPFPHCQKWHFQCPKQKNKTTSIDHGYPQVVEKNTLIHEIFLRIAQWLNFKIWDSKRKKNRTLFLTWVPSTCV